MEAMISYLPLNNTVLHENLNICTVMKGRDLQPRLLYPVKLSVRIEGQIESFPDKKKLEFIITKPLLYEMLKGLI